MKLSELAAKITKESGAPEKKPVKEVTPVKVEKETLKKIGEKVKIKEAEAVTVAPPPPPSEPPIDITGKSTWDVLMEMGEVPHYMVSKRPEWEIASEKAVVEEVNAMKPVYLLKMSEYYNTLEKMGGLSEKEVLAAKLMRDRIWNENIGDAPVDMIPLTQDDRVELEKMTITTLSGEEMPVLAASGRELAEALYLRVKGPKSLGRYKGSEFDDESKVQSEFIKELRPGFDERAQGAPLIGVRTQLSRDALYKRLLWGHARIPLAEAKTRQAKAAEWKAAVMAYYPPEYEEVKGYYRPEWKEQSPSLSQQQMITLLPEDLLKTYKIYYILKSKGELAKREEYLLDEMERLLGEFQERGLITVTRPKTAPPVAVTQEGFNDYLKVVNELFGTLPEESVVKLSRKPESDVVLKVLRSGTATEDERKKFVKTIDELFEQLPETTMNKFSESPRAGLYMRMVDKYGEG